MRYPEQQRFFSLAYGGDTYLRSKADATNLAPRVVGNNDSALAYKVGKVGIIASYHCIVRLQNKSCFSRVLQASEGKRKADLDRKTRADPQADISALHLSVSAVHARATNISSEPLADSSTRPSSVI